MTEETIEAPAYVDESWEDWDASQENWYGQQFEKCKIKDALFDETDCTEIGFTRCNLDNVDFALSYLWEAEFNDCNLEDCSFDKTKLKGATFRDCRIIGCSFFAPEHGNSLTFVNCTFEDCEFIGMMEEDFFSITWVGCKFDSQTKKLFPKDF